MGNQDLTVAREGTQEWEKPEFESTSIEEVESYADMGVAFVGVGFTQDPD